MRNQNQTSVVLIKHFFRRFFDNDTIQPDGDTTTTVVRVLSALSVPGLMVAFWLQNQYPALPLYRPFWLKIADHYFFVLFSIAVMGIVSAFEWEMLFPDCMDFLVLSPLPIKPICMFAAKVAALGIFLSIFLFAANIFGTLVLPLIGRERVMRHVAAHALAVTTAGIFASASVIAIGGMMLCIGRGSYLRTVSSLVRTILVGLFALLLLLYVPLSDLLQGWLQLPKRGAGINCSVWFLAVYERVLRSPAPPLFAREFSGVAMYALSATVLVAGLTYPLAWKQMQRLAIEGSSAEHRPAHKPLQSIIDRCLPSAPQRAVFYFIGQTIRRNSKYQAYLTMYCGVGLGMVAACATSWSTGPSGLHMMFSERGLHFVMPFLVFWTITGLRFVFSSPVALAARWVFRITDIGADECAKGVGMWTFFCACLSVAGSTLLLVFAGWPWLSIAIQAVCGILLSVFFVDAFFFAQSKVPFTKPRMPGRTNFAALLTLYVGILPPFLFGMADLCRYIEKHPSKLMWLAITVAVSHLVFRKLREIVGTYDEEAEGYEGEFQLLGLS